MLTQSLIDSVNVSPTRPQEAMSALPSTEIDAYFAPLNAEQREAISRIRSLILERCPELTEEIDQGKWYTGLLTFSAPKVGIVYALGPRAAGATTFHMMPFYGSELLRERHGAALKPTLSGKSCLKFKRYEQLPEEAIVDILNSTKTYIELASEFFEARAKKR